MLRKTMLGVATLLAACCPLAAAPPVGPGPSAAHLNSVLDSLHVETTRKYLPEYAPGSANPAADVRAARKPIKTHCNLFVHDATTALGLGGAIPLYVRHPATSKRLYMYANRMIDWMPAHGWKKVSARQAQARANEGYPVVAAWKNPNSVHHGHVAMVRPGPYTVRSGPTIAQAGALNSNKTTVQVGFKKHVDRDGMKSIQYFYFPARRRQPEPQRAARSP